MRVGIIGSGNIGGTAAGLLARAGHEVAVSNSRGPASLSGLVAGIGPGARAATREEAAAFGDVAIVAVPFGAVAELPAQALAGRVVIDATNYYPQRDGHVTELDDGRTTSSEIVARHLPGARVVKALNTIWSERLRREGRPAGDPGRLAIFVAGDDEGAKRTVAGLIDDMGFDAVDTGGLADGGRRQQPGTSVYDEPLTAREGLAILGDDVGD